MEQLKYILVNLLKLMENKKIMMEGGYPVETRQYKFLNDRGEAVLIQEHSWGHKKAVPGHGA